METGNTKFDLIVNLIKAANEKDSKLKKKIKFQVEEINKTKAIINQFEECLKQQNEMLNKLFEEKLVIKNYKNDLIEDLRKLENSDDEECEINVNGKYEKDVISVQIKSMRNDGYKNTYQNRLENRIQVGYYEQNGINMAKSMEVINEDQCQTNLNYNAKPIKIDFESSNIIGNFIIQSDNNQLIENDNFIPSPNNKNSSKRKFITLQAKRKIPENETSIFKDEDFIKNYSPKLMLKLVHDTGINVVEMIGEKNYLYVCCEKGILLIYDNMVKKWRKMYTESSKKILQYASYKNSHYLFCENEFVIFSELKTKVKEFNSNIISNLRRLHRKNPFCYISLENGEIWRYDLKIEKYEKIFSFHSKMKACINLQNKSSLFLTEDGKVFITFYQNFKEIPKLNGCVDIIASFLSIVVCYFGNGVCKIYNAVNKRLCEMKFDDSIKFARHPRSFFSVLDVQNRFHLYKFTKKTFNYEKIQEIQIPTSKNISAMSSVIRQQAFFIVEKDIYSIRFK